jgi:myo-inositol-1(or 4)-monophosphatase
MNDLDLAVTAAATGAAIVRDGFGSHQTTEQKGRLDPVTEIDRASERAIVDLLTSHRPDDGILGEEGSERHSTGRRWIIDPLDGTVNFVHGIPHVGVSVALYDGDTPLVGVVEDPIRNEVFAAERGEGATCNGVPLQVSTTTELHRSVIVTGFPYDHDQHAAAYGRVVTAVLAEVNGIRRLGSAALDFGWIAAGRFDGYWEYSLGPWDMAAGALLVMEAGGLVTAANGGPFTPGTPHFVAANPILHQKLQAIVEPILPEHILGR